MTRQSTNLGHIVLLSCQILEFCAMSELDRNDLKILALLQQDGTLGARELAEHVSLSPSPCWRRVKRLEDAAVIDRYVAVLNAAPLGLSATAYVYVSLVDHNEATITRFDQFVQEQAKVIECLSLIHI